MGSQTKIMNTQCRKKFSGVQSPRAKCETARAGEMHPAAGKELHHISVKRNSENDALFLPEKPAGEKDRSALSAKNIATRGDWRSCSGGGGNRSQTGPPRRPIPRSAYKRWW